MDMYIMKSNKCNVMHELLYPASQRLHPQVVEEILNRFGTAVANLFASRERTHCPLFFSMRRDDPPLGTDAMAHQWPQGLLYAFPPFVLLHPLLQRDQVEEVSLIPVAPNWPQMTWFSVIAPLLHDQPWDLPVGGTSCLKPTIHTSIPFPRDSGSGPCP